MVLTAIVYYATYYRTGLNLGGEGGSNAVLAMRLMEGQRPIVDTFLGYNLLWFYPLVALFKVTGPDYVAMRIFFFAVSTLSAILGFFIVRGVTRQAWLATVVAVLLVLVPGMMFRNYMGLIGVLSMLVLLRGYVLPAPTPRRQILRMGVAGLGLSVCFLLRIEPSLLLTLVWLGLAVLYPLGSRAQFCERLRTALLGTLLGIVLLLATHGAVAWHAYQRGFGSAFLNQYTMFVGLFRYEFEREWAKIVPPAPATAVPSATPAAAASVAQAPQPKQNAAPVAPQSEAAPDAARDSRLARPALTEIWQADRPRERFFGLCLYYPVFWSAAFVATASAMLLGALRRGDDDAKRRALVVLTTTGCALALFPQYFFFRPDAPHFSEFMVPFLAAVACSAFVVWEASHLGRRFWKIAVWLLLIPSILLVPIYMKAIMPREEAGTFFWSGETVEFEALNGVRVKISPEDAELLSGLRDAVLSHSEPGEYMVCYPYSPTINFMTDRPSCEWNLYIDDATGAGSFQDEAIARIDKFRPAVIVVDNRPINRTEQSRFKNWARRLMTHIDSTYQPVGTFWIGRREIEVYARPDKVAPEG